MDDKRISEIRDSVRVLQKASPHGWVSINTRQPEPEPLRGTVNLAMPVYGHETRDADDDAAVVLTAASDLLAALDAARAENQRLDELWMRYGLALRHILDLAALRAHKKIEQYVKDILGTSDELALLPVEQERDAARADVARLREAGEAALTLMTDQMVSCCRLWDEGHELECPQAALQSALAATEAQP